MWPRIRISSKRRLPAHYTAMKTKTVRVAGRGVNPVRLTETRHLPGVTITINVTSDPANQFIQQLATSHTSVIDLVAALASHQTADALGSARAANRSGPAIALSEREESYRTTLLSKLPCIKTTDVAKILYPSSVAPRRAVAYRRDQGDIIGLRLGHDYHYPVFQFDRTQGVLIDEVQYANHRMGAAIDPWAVAEWWISSSEMLERTTPLRALENGKLTRDAIDLVWKYEIE